MSEAKLDGYECDCCGEEVVEDDYNDDWVDTGVEVHYCPECVENISDRIRATVDEVLTISSDRTTAEFMVWFLMQDICDGREDSNRHKAEFLIEAAKKLGMVFPKDQTYGVSKVEKGKKAKKKKARKKPKGK